MTPERVPLEQVTWDGVNGFGRPGGLSIGPDDRLETLLRDLGDVEMGSMSRVRAERCLGLLGRMQTRVSSLMCDVTRMLEETDSQVDAAEVLRSRARVPRRESKRIAKVSRQLSDMPKTRELFTEGDITLDQASALADAAEKVGSETVEADDSLLEAADRMLPDLFRQHTRRWSDRKQIEQGMNLLERQRQAREAKLWTQDRTGLGMLLAKLPAPQFALLRQAVDRRYLELLREDSADGQDPDQVRSPKQRLHDALFELTTNRDANTGEFLPDIEGVMKAKAATQMIVVAPIGVVDGTDPDGVVEIVDVGPVPRDILKSFTEDTEIAGLICDGEGRPLRLGRKQRLANVHQRLAVAIRDGGCFQCGAPMHRCELHHMKEWHRDHGRTDVDNLVAVCRKHHRMLQTENLQVIRTPNGYQTRPRDRPG